jgi:hypothetical protein
VEGALVRSTLDAALALDGVGWLTPSDWVAVGVALLVAGVDDEDVVSLASLRANASGWDTDGPVRRLLERHSVAERSAADAVGTVARLLAMDLRARPARVTAPMTRMLAKVAASHYESPLSNEAAGAEEYLDCGCVAGDGSLERRLGGLPALMLPDDLVQMLSPALRATLPSVQPPRSH